MKRLRIVVGGFLGLTPGGGMDWDYIQWPLGFALLGHDVIYVEDTRLWPVFQHGKPGNSRPNIVHVRETMEAFGLGDRWAYRDEVTGRCLGMSLTRLKAFCRSADVFVNVSCSTVLRDEYRAIPVRALVDSDPMFTQIQFANEVSLTNAKSGMHDLFQGHTHHFTFGENIGAEDCRVPECGIRWRPVRQPICLSHWSARPIPSGEPQSFTTLMNWSAARELVFENEIWGQKNVTLLRFLDLPKMVPSMQLKIAVNQTAGAPFPADLFRAQGWTVLDPVDCARDWNAYRTFLSMSFGEFSVAKETYVKARTGWFSCRSACYLASGRPVVTQETGWSRYLPVGRGLFAFQDMETATEALRRVAESPVEHSRAARELAHEFFSSDTVLAGMLQEMQSQN